VGNFSGGFYWSSSEASATFAFRHEFSTGNQDDFFKSSVGGVRACRSFTAAIGAYALRSIGPAGGWVFYTDGSGNYLEAAPTDQSASVLWSDDTTNLIGTTGTAIGTGQANTTAMLAQSATAPSAKLCNDLSIGGWINDTDGAYCAYDNDTDNIPVYGLLYNWYAVDNAAGLAYLKRNGVQETGWRVPTDADFTALSTELGGDVVSGGKLKEIGTTHWTTPNTGADNSSGFTALGSGYRAGDNGSFQGIKGQIYLWTTTVLSGSLYWYAYVRYNSASFNLGGNYMDYGFSVRLVKDI
jgi:uncharacterized protein (TIGR02145 family)